MIQIQDPYSFDEIDVSKLTPDAHGRVKVKAKIMTTGKLKYVTPSGKVYYGDITLDNLKKARESAKYKPVTVRHPPDLINEKDVDQFMEGVSTDAAEIEEIDGKPWLVNTLILQTERAQNTVREGKFGVSAGYFRNAIPKEGNVLDFSNIDINHIAIGCLNPRAEGAEIYSLDDAEGEAGRLIPAKQQNPKKEVTMHKQTLEAVEVGGFSLDEALVQYDDSAETESAVKTFMNREKKLKAELKNLQKSLDEKESQSTTKLGEISGELKAANEKIKAMQASLDASVSMDEVKEKVKEFAVIESLLDQYEIKESFDDATEGWKLIIDKAYPGMSYDDSEIPGLKKSILKDKEHTKKLVQSNKALQDGKKSMDSANRVSFSQIDVGMIKKAKLYKRGK